MKFARSGLLLSLLFSSSFPGSAWSTEPLAGRADLEVGASSGAGYFKSYLIGLFPKAIEGVPESASLNTGYQFLNSARLNGYYRPLQNLKLEAGYEFQAVFQGGSSAKAEGSAGAFGSALPLARGASYRLFDLKTEIGGAAGDRSTRFYQNLDRFVAYWDLKQADVTIGRQAITFGSARAIQATDVLLPYSFQQLSVEYRIGVDAIRAQIPLSQMGELDLGLVVGDGARANESAAFVRTQLSIEETDVILLAMGFSGAKMLGGGAQRAIWQLGYSLDFAQVWAEKRESYFRLSQGLDYAFESGLILFGEYHFNGAGANDPAEYLSRFGSFALQRGGVFLLGRHYLIPGVAYPLTPLLNAQAQALINVQDSSIYLSSGLEYGASESLYFELGVSAALGASPRLNLFGVSVESEFGSYPVQAYGAVRIYF